MWEGKVLECRHLLAMLPSCGVRAHKWAEVVRNVKPASNSESEEEKQVVYIDVGRSGKAENGLMAK